MPAPRTSATSNIIIERGSTGELEPFGAIIRRVLATFMRLVSSFSSRFWRR